MAADCNVIASSVGGLGEVVRHLHNGLTVLPDNPMSIVWAVNQLFSDPGAAARRRAAAITRDSLRLQLDARSAADGCAL